MNIAILGASGCVGQNLIKRLLDSSKYEVIAAYRTIEEIPEAMQYEHLTWRQVNLLDASSTENFLHDADILIYLIHSLAAKNFEQLDIQLANAAGRAAQHIGVRKIIYLGGIIPERQKPSPHLESRMKTGLTLASYGIPVAEVRASILLETCSWSYLIVYYLSKRLPIIIAPRWLNSFCAPIALQDAASFLEKLISRPITGHEIFEIGSDVVRYRDLLALCGISIRGFKNIIIPVPFLTIRMAARWLQLLTGVPNNMGMALAEGLRNDTAPSHNRFREITGKDPLPLQLVLQRLAEEMRGKRG